MPTLDDDIARHLAAAAVSGELRSAPSYGRPLAADEGWDATPEALRMPFKILRDAGVAPQEIALFHDRARLREALDAAPGEDERRAVRVQLAALEQKLALRLEALRRNATL